MVGFYSTYVQATEEPVEGRVFPVEPGSEDEDIDVIRTTVDRCTEKAGRRGGPREVLGVFVATDALQNVIPDGTHKQFLTELRPGIHSIFVKAAEAPVTGWVFLIEPGSERETVEIIRKAVDRYAERAGRGGDRQEMLGVFVAADTIRNVIPDGTHEPFLIELLLEIYERKAARNRGTERENAKLDSFIADVRAGVESQWAAVRQGEDRDETEV